MPNSKFLTLRRKGKFKIETTGNNHCGLDEEQAIKYWVSVTCKAKPSLDDRGFLFEQRTIDEFFQSYNGDIFHESCEILAIDFCRQLREAIREENPKCKILFMEVRLAAKPYLASMTHSWIKGQKD